MGADGPKVHHFIPERSEVGMAVCSLPDPSWRARLQERKTIPRSDLIMAALPIRTKPHLPERASKLQDISTEFFQGHRPCFAFIMARSEMPSPKGFMNRRSNAFSHVFLYGRPGRLRKPEMRACVRFLAKEGGNRCLCSARHLFLVGVYRRCFNCQPSEAQDAQQSGLSSKEGQHFV
jgi:hypothetical protein